MNILNHGYNHSRRSRLSCRSFPTSVLCVVFTTLNLVSVVRKRNILTSDYTTFRLNVILSAAAEFGKYKFFIRFDRDTYKSST